MRGGFPSTLVDKRFTRARNRQCYPEYIPFEQALRSILKSSEMKCVLFLLPLALAACAPTTSYQVETLPLRTGQVWRYTLLETDRAPESVDITVEDIGDPSSRGRVSRFQPLSGVQSSPREEAVLYYTPPFASSTQPLNSGLTAQLRRGTIFKSCRVRDVVNTRSHFEGDLTLYDGLSSRVKASLIGKCTLELAKVAY